MNLLTSEDDYENIVSLLFLCALAVPVVAQSTQDSTVNPQEQNKALVRRFYAEVWEKGNLAVADEVFAANYVRHDPRGGPPAEGPEGQKQIAAWFRSHFSDFDNSVELIAAEADLVAARWTIRGTPKGLWAMLALGRRFEMTGVNIFRINNGKVVEIWNHRDDLGARQNLNIPKIQVAASFITGVIFCWLIFRFRKRRAAKS